MKLWRCEITTEVYVLANNATDARLTAEENYHELGRFDFDIWPTETRALNEVDADWRDSIPYGSEDDRTVRQLLEPPK